MKQQNIKFLLALLISMLGVKASAHDLALENADGVTIYYNFINNRTELAVSYKGEKADSYSNEYSGNVVIPEFLTYNGTIYSVTSIGDYAFKNCSGLTSIDIPNSLTSIGGYAFYGCSGLTSIDIPNSVASIGGYAFYGCSSLSSIDIPNSVSSIGSRAFYGTAWYENQPDGLVYAGKVVYNYKGEMPTNTNIILEEGTLGIAGFAFGKCSGLTSINIPNSVTSIGGAAFYGCSGLTSIDIPNSVTCIDESTFEGCSGLTSITIPISVTSIGESAFEGCNGLIEVNYNATNCTTMGAYNLTVFSGCSSLSTVTIGDNVQNIPNYMFSGCSGLTSVTIPNSVTSIGFRAFAGCSSLTSINIPNSVTSIGESAFVGCSGLASITIPNSVTSIWDGTFWGCSGLTSVTIPNSVTSIGYQAFYGCSDLSSIIIPNSVTCIERESFYNCSSLTSVTIPSSVTSIGEFAFVGCNNLLVVNSEILEPFNFKNSVFPWNTFRNGTLYIPAGTKDLYTRFDGWREFLRIEEVGGEQEQYVWLTMKDGRGSTMLKVKKGAAQELAIKPETGWKILMATMDGTDISAQIKSGNVYTTPAIRNDATINIIYEKDDPSGTVTARQSKADIKVVDDGVIISNAEPQSRCVVYSSGGQQVVNTVIKDGSRRIPLQKGQVYILTVNGRTLKFAL